MLHIPSFDFWLTVSLCGATGVFLGGALVYSFPGTAVDVAGYFVAAVLICGANLIWRAVMAKKRRGNAAISTDEQPAP